MNKNLEHVGEIVKQWASGVVDFSTEYSSVNLC